MKPKQYEHCVAENISQKICAELTESENFYQKDVMESGNGSRAPLSFDDMWCEYIMPLKGKTLNLPSFGTNKILEVDWSGIKRITSKGKKRKIPIAPFRWAYNRLREKGEVFREDINFKFNGRFSSGVALILSQVPFIEQYKVNNKACLRIKINNVMER